MPPLTRWMIKTSLIYFLLGLTLAGEQALRAFGTLPALFGLPTMLHVLVVGWITQLIFGVVFWMFPKYSSESPRGNEKLMWVAYFALNLGLLLRLTGEPWFTLAPSTFSGGLLAASAAFQWLAGILFVILTWPRVKER
jgi:hypothetical protein